MEVQQQTYPGMLKMVRTSHPKPRIRDAEQELDGFVTSGPKVGSQMYFLGGGRVIHTSDVVSIDWKPDGFQVETEFSVYAVRMDPDVAQRLRTSVETPVT